MKVEERAGLSYLVSEANSLKVKAGLAFDEAITNLLEQLEAAEVIKGFKSPVNYAHEDYKYTKQYKADYLIETIDSKIIIVRSSSSFRQDRIKLGFYDLDGISNYGNIGKNVIASIYLVDDIESSGFNKVRRMFARGEYYSPATHLFYLSEFVDFLNEYKHSFEAEREEQRLELEQQKLFETELYSEFDTAITTGSDFGKAGNQLERTIVKLLSEESNLRALKEGFESCDSVFKKIIQMICLKEDINLDSVLSINATNVITMLRSNGSPKTDVKVVMNLDDTSTLVATLSIKNTTAKHVSCHDYKVESFIRVLGCENTKLAEYLELFQKFPKYGVFEERLGEGMSLNEFKKLLDEKAKIFSEWVTMGKHDDFNLIDPETQVSKYLFINNWKTRQNAFYLYEDYIDLLNEQRNEKFGVPFSWTYPSSNEGKRIQLKLPIIIQ